MLFFYAGRVNVYIHKGSSDALSPAFCKCIFETFSSLGFLNVLRCEKTAVYVILVSYYAVLFNGLCSSGYARFDLLSEYDMGSQDYFLSIIMLFALVFINIFQTCKMPY